MGERGKIKSTAASSLLRASMGARITVTTESTGGGARAMTANDVSRSMPSLSRSFKSRDLDKLGIDLETSLAAIALAPPPVDSVVVGAAMTATAQASASLGTCCSW